MAAEKASGLNLRTAMPGVAAAVDKARTDLGAAWVNECIRQAIAGVPDQFFAFEAGHVLGTPWTLDAALRDSALQGAMFGARFFMAIRQPDGQPTGKG